MVLRTNPQYDLVTLNYSSTATPELVMTTFQQRCVVERKGNKGYIVRPSLKNKIFVISRQQGPAWCDGKLGDNNPLGSAQGRF